MNKGIFDIIKSEAYKLVKHSNEESYGYSAPGSEPQLILKCSRTFSININEALINAATNAVITIKDMDVLKDLHSRIITIPMLASFKIEVDDAINGFLIEKI